MNVRLYLWQRLTAAILLPLLLAHLAGILYVSHTGMTAAEILARTRGSFGWAAFYATLVIAAAIHAGIGLRNVFAEWSPLSERAAGILASLFSLALLLLGLRAVAAVVLA